MKILLKFPTRNRPDKCLRVLKKYTKMMEGSDYKIMLSCDNDDETMKQPHIVEALKRFENIEVHYGDNKSKIEAVNADMDKAGDYDIILLVSDDMIPQVKGFDNIIRKAMEDNFPDTDGVVWFYDGGYKPDLNTLCILGRKYYERFGYIYHPSYKSFYCDDEFTQVANMLGKQVRSDQVIIKHMPQALGYEQQDKLFFKNLVFEEPDKALFAERKKKNFDIK